MTEYEQYVQELIAGEATDLLAIAERRGFLPIALLFAMAAARRALDGDGDLVEAGIALDIECLRAREQLEGFDYGGQIRQLTTMRDRMRNDSTAYLAELVAKWSE